MPLYGEIFVSEILKKPVFDPTGEDLGRLRDVSIVKGETFPKVHSLVVEKKKRAFVIPWRDVNMFNKRIMSVNVSAGSAAEYGYPEDDLLVARDILDKQIVDANGVKVVRANDIKLDGYNGQAMLVAVDVGLRGIMRRMGFERQGEGVFRFFRAKLSHNLISWNYLQPLQPKLSDIALNIPGQMVAELHPADLADLISQVSQEEGAQFIERLDVETAAEAISELEPDIRKAMISDMEAGRAADIIEEMNPDAAADVIGSLPAEKAQAILGRIEKEEAEDIQELLNHEEDTAGGLMTNDFIAYPPNITVSDFLRRFRKDAEEIESVYYIYLTDEEERLLGIASLRDVLLMEPDSILAESMETNIKSVGPEADEMTAVGTIAKYNLLALPVVDGENHLLGIITMDDIVDRILPARARRKFRGV